MARIAFISHWSGRGGAERALLEIVDACRQAGHAAVVVAPREGWLCEVLRERGVEVHVVRYPWWAATRTSLPRRVLRVLLLPIAVFRLHRLLAGIRADIVYSNTTVICVGALAARTTRLPHVWHLHEPIHASEGVQFDWGRELSQRLIARWSDVVVGASQTTLTSLKQTCGVVLYLAPSWPEELAEKRAGAERRLIVVGELTEAKRQADAIRALALLRCAGRNVELELVGSGDRAAVTSLKRLASSLQLQEHVHFSGTVQELPHRISSSHALLNCSAIEGFGRVSIEAMMLRTPVIAAAAGANIEIVKDRETGLLYPPGDAPALAAAITRLFDDSALEERIVKRAYSFARAISNPQCVVHTLDHVVQNALAKLPYARGEARAELHANAGCVSRQFESS